MISPSDVVECMMALYKYYTDKPNQHLEQSKDLVLGRKYHMEYRGILTDTEEPVTSSDEQGNLQPTPTLTNFLLLLFNAIFAGVIKLFGSLIGFNYGSSGNIILGRK